MRHDQVTDNWLTLLALCLVGMFCFMTLVSCGGPNANIKTLDERIENHHQCVADTAGSSSLARYNYTYLRDMLFIMKTRGDCYDEHLK